MDKWLSYPLRARITGHRRIQKLAISACFVPDETGMGLREMELTDAAEEDDSMGGQAGAGADAPRSPIENPGIDPIPNDPLLVPHPHEPGVHDDGTAAPLENPDDSVPLGTWQAGTPHTFTFTVTLAADAGNEFQGASSTVDFTWDATQAT